MPWYGDRCTVYFRTCKIWNFPGLVVIAESTWAESLVMRDRETFATVIARSSYRAVYFYARSRVRARGPERTSTLAAASRNIQGTSKTNATHGQEYIPYFCSTFGKYFECLSIRELKRRIL